MDIRNYSPLVLLFIWCCTVCVAEPPTIIRGLSNITVVDGTDYSLLCEATGDPPLTFVWKKMDKKVSAVRYIEQEPVFTGNVTASVLRIEPLKRRKDSEEFSCTVSNNEGEVTSSGHLQALQDKFVPEGFPEILQHPQISVAENGRRAKMVCEAEGNPTPDVSWYRDYQLLNVDGNRLQLEEGTQNLVIEPAGSSDQGRYHCGVSNTHGVRFSLPAFLYVREPAASPPEWDIVPTSGPIFIGSSMNFTCAASGNPIPTVQWYEGSTPAGQPIESDYGRSVLLVENIQRDLTYNCYAYNDYGTISNTLSIQPIENAPDTPAPVPGTAEPPEFTYEPTNTLLERGGSTFLLCSASGNPIPDIRWLNKGDVLDQSVPGTGYSYLAIRDFQETDSFTCHAYNPHGQIFRSVTVTLTGDGGGGPGTATEAPRTPMITTATVTRRSPTTRPVPTPAGVTPPSGITPSPGGNGGGNGQGPEAVRVEADSVFLRWSPVPDARSYVVEYKTAGGLYEYVTQTVDNEYLIENLQPYTQYTFRVSYVDQNGVTVEGSEIFVQTAETNPDTYPRDLQAVPLPSTNGDAPALEVSFTRPDTSGTVIGYNIYYTDDPNRPFSDWGKMTLPASGESQITGIIGNLLPDTTYYLSSTIMNSAGEGPASFLAVATTGSGGQPSVPNPPEAPLVRDVTASSVTLIFTSAADIRSFTLEYQESNLLPDFNAIPGIVETEYTVGNLKPNTEYTFRVSGENDQGPSGPSRETAVTTSGGQDLLPAPSQPQVDAVDATLVSLRWQPGSSDPVDYYILEYFRTDTGATQSVDVFDTSYTVDRLEPFTEYVFRVYPINASGRGQSSQETRITTTEFPPGSPPEALTATPITSSEIQLQWEPPTIPFGVIRGYTVYYTPSPPPPAPSDWSVTTTSQPQLRLTDLEPNQLYNFRVSAFNSVGDGPASLTVVAQTPPPTPTGDVPQPPTNIQGEAISPTSIRLQWEPNTADQVTSYIVEYNLPFPDDSLVRRVEVPTNSATIDGLEENSEYAFRVRASNDNGPGELSPAVVIQTPAEGIPLAPSTPRADEVTDTSITFSWAPGSSDTVYYLIQYMNLATQEANSVEVYDTTYTLSDLPVGTEYVIRVFGLNSQGAGNPSDIITVTTGEEVSPPSGVPAAPKNLEGRSLSDSMVSLRWVPGDSAEVDQYYIRWSNVADPGDAGNDYSVASDYTATNLQPGSTYTFIVAAENTYGLSPFSEGVDVTLQQTGPVILPAPSTPEVIETTANSIAFFWQPGGNDEVYYYTIQYVRTDTGDSQTVDTPDTSYTLMNLEPDTEYSIRVFPYNQAGRGEGSVPKYERTRSLGPVTLPAPSTPEVIETTADSIAIFWQPGSSDPVYYYTIQYVRTDTGDSQTVDTSDTSYTLINLEPGTEYSIRVFPFNQAGRGQASEAQLVRTRPVDTAPPSAPSVPEFREVTATSVTLTWESADDVAYYIVQYERPDIGEVYSDIVYLNEWTVVGLEPETYYTFEVSAVNRFGSSEPSEQAPVVTLGIPDTPGRLETPAIIRSTSDSVTLRWQPSTASYLDYYILEYWQADDFQGTYRSEELRNLVDTTYIVRGLSPDVEYGFRVSAVNIFGRGEPSYPAYGATARSGTGTVEPPTEKPTTDGPMTQEPSTGEPSTGEPSTGEPSTGEPSTGEPSTGEPSTVEPSTGEPSTEEPSVTEAPIDVVGGPKTAPTGVEVDLICADTALVMWEPLESNDTVTGYNVYYFTNEFDVQNVTVNGDKRFAVVKGLTGGVVHNFAVRAINQDREGPESDVVSVETEIIVPDVPIQNLEAEFVQSNDTNEIILSWRHGDVQIFYSDSESREEFNATVSNTVTYVISNVTFGSTYNIELISGSTSYIITVQAQEEVPTTEATVRNATLPPPGPESLIKEIKAFAVDDTTVRVYWYPVKDTDGEEILGYAVRYQLIPEPEVISNISGPLDVTEDNVTVINVDASQFTYDLEGLEEGVTYQIIVFANTSAGLGPGSDALYIKVEKDAEARDKLDEEFAKLAFRNHLIRTLANAPEYVAKRLEGVDLIQLTEPDTNVTVPENNTVLVYLLVTLQKKSNPPGLDELINNFVEYWRQFVTLPTEGPTAAMEILEEGSTPQPIGGEEGSGDLPKAPSSSVKEVTYRAIDDKIIRLQWFPPKDTMEEIKSYTISYQPVDKDQNPLKDTTTVTVDSTVLEYDLKDLESNTMYEIIVFVSNSEGDGPGSEPIYVMFDKDAKDGVLPPP